MSVALEFDIDQLGTGRAATVQPGPARPRLRAVPDRPAAPVARTAAASVGASPVALLRAPAGHEAVAPLRLTRRGVVVLGLVVAAVGGALVWLAALSASSSPAAGGAAPMPATVTVHSGDTLWSIASRYAGQRDPRALVADLQSRNHLVDAQVVPGQLLHLR